MQDDVIAEIEQAPAAPAPREPQRFMIVGLGNPGRQYQNTRHNIGFKLVDLLAARWDIALGTVQFKGVVGTGRLGDHRVILAKPQTYMNLSGDTVGPLANYYKVPPINVMVAYDELDLDFGVLRLRPKGGAGGHNGMRSIIQHLGQTFPRLRLGIGRPPGRMPPKAFVLRPFDREELEIVDLMLENAAGAVEIFIRDGLEPAMNRYNGPVVA